MKSKLIGLGAIGLFFILLLISALLILTPRWAYQVTCQGRLLGAVGSLAEYRQILEDIQTRAEDQWGCDLLMNEEVAATRVRLWAPQLSPAAVEAAIETAATYQTKGWAIVVNGASVVIVDKEETARGILEEAKALYVSKDKNCTLVSASFQESVNIESMAVTPEALTDKDEALALLTCGQEKNSSYVVQKGDTLSQISRAQNVPMAALREANSLAGDLIQVGQVLNLQASSVFLHVKTVEELSATETIARSVQYRINPDKSVRGDKILEAGADGRRDITYQVVKINGGEISRSRVASKVTREPTSKIVLTGIGYWPARPTGMFRFPVNGGTISSPFGAPRSYGRHKAVDIANPRGVLIYAAASGTITAMTRGTTYGRYIVIQHSDGYSTLYAHLQEYAGSLRVGSKVVRGQVIGKVGNSGRTTGPHLHWEVRRYGEAVNPLKFFGN